MRYGKRSLKRPQNTGGLDNILDQMAIKRIPGFPLLFMTVIIDCVRPKSIIFSSQDCNFSLFSLVMVSLCPSLKICRLGKFGHHAVNVYFASGTTAEKSPFGSFKADCLTEISILLDSKLVLQFDGIKTSLSPTAQGMYVSLSRLTPFFRFGTNQVNGVSLERLTYSFSSSRRCRIS